MGRTGPNLKPELNQINKQIEEIKEGKWYQKWWGAFLLGVFSGITASFVCYLFFIIF